MDTSTVLSTSGYQYTNNVLDFFPHTSAALSAGAEGYVKAINVSEGPTINYAFRYVFNFTDHRLPPSREERARGRHNIRLKYAQDPSNNNEVSILEEDHYYPYGLKHLGYNTAHKIFKGIEGPGTGITLTPVNPFLGDSYKYKFGGKEYDDTFNINTYDFGARNYDPALGRWMNLDPLAEAMRRHSPYNYAFDNPVYFIDPDGMFPTDSYGMSTATGAVDVIGGFDVNTVDGEGNILSTEYHANINDANNAASAIDATIDHSGGGGDTGGGASLTNKRNVGGVAGLSMGADGVGEVDSGNKNPLLSNSKAAVSTMGKFFSLGSMGMSYSDWAKGGGATTGVLSKYLRTFGRVGLGATVGLDYMAYKDGQMGGGEFFSNTYFSSFSLIGGFFGIGFSSSYYVVGDLLGGKEKARKHFERIQSLSPAEKQEWISEQLRKRHHRGETRNPKF